MGGWTGVAAVGIAPMDPQTLENRDCSHRMGEELAGSEKLGSAPKVLRNLWGSAELFFKLTTSFLQMRNLLQNLPAEPQRFAEFWGGVGSLDLTGEDWFFSFHRSCKIRAPERCPCCALAPEMAWRPSSPACWPSS